MDRVVFSHKSDEWSTPDSLFGELDVEFNFRVDAAAILENRKCEHYLGLDNDYPYNDALVSSWRAGPRGKAGAVWCNPPYSKCADFVKRAVFECSYERITVVMLLPARTDTRWFHAYIWDRTKNRPYPGVEVRFLKGRLKFGDAKNSAPFPSMVVIFRPV